jgi:hypothetical protein
MRLCKGTTEGPRRVRQLDGAFLFGHERIVANSEVTPFWSYFLVGGHSGIGQFFGLKPHQPLRKELL